MAISMSSMALSSTVPARLEFACGHAALAALPRIKGEGLRQQTHRVNEEKMAAQARPCDFRGPRGVALSEAEPVTTSGAPGEPALHHQGTAVAGASRPDPAVANGHQPHASHT